MGRWLGWVVVDRRSQICSYCLLVLLQPDINVIFGMKFTSGKIILWLQITMATLALDLVVVSFIKIFFVWLLPRIFLGVFIVVFLVAFVAMSAGCEAIAAHDGCS